ncbi:helix-turn-helix transcriptional regulator [Micromonospora echinospora]|uniref:helix-turn-helix transcriptional regulator n=1 Tax=Micromonospora echinospora TaxID=1877 RepID=UPI003787B638
MAMEETHPRSPRTPVDASTGTDRLGAAVAGAAGTAGGQGEGTPDAGNVAELPWPVAGIVRATRRRVGASQRELARLAGIHHTTVGRIEAGRSTPSLDLLQRIIAVGGLRLAVVDESGRVIQPMRDWDDTRDGADRRYPSHLDTILDPGPGEWWADVYGLARPPETFHRDVKDREARRRRSQWEVRVAKYRDQPPPLDPRRYPSVR